MCELSPAEVNVLLVSIWKLVLPGVFFGFLLREVLGRIPRLIHFLLRRSRRYRELRYRHWLVVWKVSEARRNAITARYQLKNLRSTAPD
ncbi:hypothetical protein [Janthinobacterium sp. HH01]|uniref:hypothetical protein n=1 Tax=Janthinobacterium sp. HH01 TaxID=1198452 RepID=UPI00126922ED|nr:hypothetical protein [Janthinobacterium sp. HH01]